VARLVRRQLIGAARLAVICTLVLLAGCRPFSNPVDPLSTGYQGYLTVGTPEEVAPTWPAEGQSATWLRFTASCLPGADRYEAQVSSSGDAFEANALVDKTSTTNGILLAAPDSVALEAGPTYYWRVRASEGGTWGPWSGIASFLCEDFAGSDIAPASGDSTDELLPTLEWTTLAGAAGYQVQCSSSEADVREQAVRDASSASYLLSDILAPTVYWRVRAVDASGAASGWIHLASFRMARAHPGTLDVTFAAGAGADGSVFAIALQEDGKILIGGDFTTYDGIARGRLARLNSDGSLDTTFATESGADGRVSSIVLQADGRILIGGWFTGYDGTPRGHVARINPEGTLDASFAAGSGADDIVEAIAQQEDGKVLIGGEFTTYDGASCGYLLARLNTDGTLDATYPASGTGPGDYEGGVHAVVPQEDGTILVGGGFYEYNGAPCEQLVRLSTDGIFIANQGGGFKVEHIVPQPDGKILASGWNMGATCHCARFSADGTADTSFAGLSASGRIGSIALQGDGKVLVGGSWQDWSDYPDLGPREYLARLYADGSRDTSFSGELNGSVDCMVLQADGKIIIGGGFTTCSGMTRRRVARLWADQ
jgi:uncharacterized delta-60 repeat protein